MAKRAFKRKKRRVGKVLLEQYAWHILIDDTWHILFKHGKPKRLRKSA